MGSSSTGAFFDVLKETLKSRRICDQKKYGWIADEDGEDLLISDNNHLYIVAISKTGNAH